MLQDANHSSVVMIGRRDCNLQRSTEMSHKTSGTKFYVLIRPRLTSTKVMIGDAYDSSSWMNSEDFKNIRSVNLQRNASKLTVRNFIMQQDNDAKHSVNTRKDFIRLITKPWPN